MARNFISLLCIVLFVVACNSTPTNQAKSDFDRLCKIYEGIVQLPIEVGMKEIKLSENIQKQLPEFYEKYYVHISTADRNKKYNLIKKLADPTADENWECEKIRTYYDGGYDQ